MDLGDIANSGLVQTIIGTFFGVIGWAVNTLRKDLKDLDSRTKDLEIQTNDLSGVKQSIVSFGQRLGATEAQDQVMHQMFEQFNEALREIKASERENNVAFSSILQSINEMKNDLNLIKYRLDERDKEYGHTGS